MVVAEPVALTARPMAGALIEFLLLPWRVAMRLPPLVWLGGTPGVHVLHADGSDSVWSGSARRTASAADRQRCRWLAVELSSDEHLESRVEMPAMASDDRQAALALEARSASPFEPEDLVWGARPLAPAVESGTHLLVLASRRVVQARLDALRSALPDHAALPEVWAFASDGAPVVLRGFGESRRLRGAERGRRLELLLLGTATLLALAIVATPTVKLLLRTQQARLAYQSMEQASAGVLAQREALAKAQSHVDDLRQVMAERVDPLAVLDTLTQALPDDTWLQRIQVQGSRVTMNGQTPNAAALMNRLSGLPQVRDVKAPSPATRGLGSQRENFVIELSLVPEAPASASAAAASAAAGAPAAAATGTPVTSGGKS